MESFQMNCDVNLSLSSSSPFCHLRTVLSNFFFYCFKSLHQDWRPRSYFVVGLFCFVLYICKSNNNNNNNNNNKKKNVFVSSFVSL